ncbi:hypothetical protein FYK55_04265 [Roseiconus nitratireducens]|uniref:Uncharacterized protein n=1 Tax=Roseiconus nitratireducens TaxID=2605748 RepID=A0A5M6DEZ7_9BACT|nr:hypothetical protein [Roseiconus nitratireducens]KAA5546117.1 hypothetical protein FYK55_04265 [Roseiconus nitratireducens]
MESLTAPSPASPELGGGIGPNNGSVFDDGANSGPRSGESLSGASGTAAWQAANDPATGLSVEGFTLSPEELAVVSSEINRVRPLVTERPEQLPHVSIRFDPDGEIYHVLIDTEVSGQSVHSRANDGQWQTALRTAIRKLVPRFEAAVESNGTLGAGRESSDEEAVGRARWALDESALQRAVEQNNYAQFRAQLYPLEPHLHERIGREVRCDVMPDEAHADHLFMADIIEDLFLMAFEQFDQRPQDITFVQWLDSLIAPTIAFIGADNESCPEFIDYPPLSPLSE